MAAFRSTTVRYWSTGLRIVTILFLTLSAFGPAYVTPAYADKPLVCGIPGRDGPVPISGIVNTYYPGTADVDAGSTSIPVGAPSGAAAPIQAGDLLLVIQMQGADINSTNTDAYGNGVAGPPASGNLGTNFSAGLYEYVIATSAVTGGAVSISSGLVNNYFNQDYSGTQGQRRFQVIRVPQYSSATIVGTVTSLPWTGRVGGVAALDVAGTLNLNGNAVNVSGQGFRGGGGVRYTGAAGFAATDYRTPSTATLNASKGEGIAGTPRFVFNGTTVVDNIVEGYPNGSFARGAPGNAGGGGTDGDPAGNEDNAGGGGGANGGAGGLGGFGWRSVSDSGGFGGAAFPYTPTRLVMGGGGGAGDINNNDPVLSSGGAGGGIVMIRAGTVSGSGTINANGADGQDQPLNDSGGGGGAGGTVLVVSGDDLPGGLNVNAAGGDGGNAWPGMSNGVLPYPGWRHGPGGGGGGGVILLNSTAGALSVAQGVHGVTTTDSDFYGSQDGQPGDLDTTVTRGDLTTSISGYGCIPNPIVVKTTSTPLVTQTPTGTTGQYTIDVRIPTGEGTALAFTISDVLPTGFTYASTIGVNLSGGATRPTASNPTAGTSNPAWGTFDIPGGGRVQITFTVNIASTVPAGTYQNPATATYLDPTRTTTNGTTDSQYDSGSSTGEDITVELPNGADLSILKTDGQTSYVPGSVVTYTVTVTNLGPDAANGATVTDPRPANITTWAWACTTQSGGATGCNAAASSASNFTDTVNLPVGGTIVYTVTANTLAGATTNLVNTATIAVPPGLSDPNTANNTSTDSNAPPTPAPDLSIIKTNAQTSYVPNSVVTYTITVTNLSGVTANGATVTDNKPANITTWAWACTTQSGGATGCDPAADSANDFTDTVNLPVGGTIVYTVTANVSASATGNLVNTAEVTTPPGLTDSNPGNNTSTVTTPPPSPPGTVDLSVTKDNGQTTFIAGQEVKYTVTVRNNSGVTATGAVVSDPKPANITTWAWACTTQSGGATGCNAVASGSKDFTDTVNLPVGASIIYTVTAKVVAIPTGTTLENSVNVDPPSGVTDSDPANNSATDLDELGPSADLSLTKTASATKVDAGDTITFTLTLENAGPDTAYDVEVTDKLPSGFTYVSSIASKGIYDSVTGVWAVGEMPAKATETLKITVIVNSSGDHKNVAEITQSLADAVSGISLSDPDSTPGNGIGAGAGEDDLASAETKFNKPDNPPKKTNPFLIPVTGFQPGVVTDLSRVPHETYLATADVTLEIPSLGVKIPIVGVPKKDGTWNVTWLENQAGWLEGSAFPSWKGNSVLTSHVYLYNGKPGPFAKLIDLQYGDKVIVHAFGQKYTFVVQTNKAVMPNDTSVMKHEEKPWLTLITCRDYDVKNDTYINRTVVRAALLSIEEE